MCAPYLIRPGEFLRVQLTPSTVCEGVGHRSDERRTELNLTYPAACDFRENVLRKMAHGDLLALESDAKHFVSSFQFSFAQISDAMKSTDEQHASYAASASAASAAAASAAAASAAAASAAGSSGTNATADSEEDFERACALLRRMETTAECGGTACWHAWVQPQTERDLPDGGLAQYLTGQVYHMTPPPLSGTHVSPSPART